MKKNISYPIFILLTLLSALFANAQDDGRTLLRGKVMYRNVNVPNENVINVTAETVVSTDEDGEFAIEVKVGDMLAFTSLNYDLASTEITQDILDNGRLVVEVNEKVTELDEVVITPENQGSYLNVKSEELGEYGKYTDEKDQATEIENTSLPIQDRGLQHGLNFVNLAKLLFKKHDSDTKNEDNTPKLKLSQILLQVYDKKFFVLDLKIPQDKIQDFVYYLDSRPFSRDLLKKNNEFQFIDFLVNESNNYRKQLADKK